jgi:diamine N-acetyltransferase
MSGNQVRRAVADDTAALARFAAWSFTDSFWRNYPPEDLGAFIAQSYAEARIAGEIASPHHAMDVATDPDGTLAGYCFSGPMGLPLEDAEPGAWELKRIYLAPAAKGTGLADTLLVRCLEAGGATGATAVYLGVWSQNPRAQAYYRKRGFEEVGSYTFPVGRVRDHELIMRRWL